MIPLNKGSYIKHVYKINVIECHKEIVERIEQELPKGSKKDHFKMMFDEALKVFQESVGIRPRMRKNGLKYKTLHEIETSHPAFYNWLAYFLTLQKPHKIPHILNTHSQGSFGSVPNFNNAIEHGVLDLLTHVPFDHAEQDQMVSKWVLDNNYASLTKNGDYKDYIENPEDMPKIIIDAVWQEKLRDFFTVYIDSNVNKTLYDSLFEGNHVKGGNEIFLNLKANVFCDGIRRLHEKGGIINSKKNKIAKWIITNFKFDVKGDKGKIKENYCIQLLSGKDQPNTKDQLILLD